MVDSLRALTPKAVQVLAQALEGEAAVPAAIHILKCVGLYGGIAAPRGPTDPQVLAAAQHLAEDASQHAEEEASLTIRRKAYDRYLADVNTIGPMPLS